MSKSRSHDSGTDAIFRVYRYRYRYTFSVLGVGAAVLVTTVLGCCGISRESWLLVLLYASACGLLILLEVLISCFDTVGTGRFLSLIFITSTILVLRFRIL